jgi:hypothetical protein
MDCLRSFNLAIAGQGNQAAAQGFDSWLVGVQHFWLYQATALDSTFNVEGFKNINIHKISLTGDVYSGSAPAGVAAIVQNWNVDIQIVGQNAILGGNISAAPNGFSMIEQPINPIYCLSKFQKDIEFPTPIQSAKQIIVSGLYADGIACESLVSAQLEWFITINIFYKYEGE